MKEFDTCLELHFTICVLLFAFVGWYIECENVHGVSNIKFISVFTRTRHLSLL